MSSLGKDFPLQQQLSRNNSVYEEELIGSTNQKNTIPSEELFKANDSSNAHKITPVQTAKQSHHDFVSAFGDKANQKKPSSSMTQKTHFTTTYSTVDDVEKKLTTASNEDNQNEIIQTYMIETLKSIKGERGTKDHSNGFGLQSRRTSWIHGTCSARNKIHAIDNAIAAIHSAPKSSLRKIMQEQYQTLLTTLSENRSIFHLPFIDPKSSSLFKSSFSGEKISRILSSSNKTNSRTYSLDSNNTRYSETNSLNEKTHKLSSQKDIEKHFLRGNRNGEHACCIDNAALHYAYFTKKPLTQSELHQIRNIGDGVDKVYTQTFSTTKTRVANIASIGHEAITSTLKTLDIPNDALISLPNPQSYEELFKLHGDGIYLTFGTEPTLGGIELHAETIEAKHNSVVFSGWSQKNNTDPKTKYLINRVKSSQEFIASSNRNGYQITHYYFCKSP